MVLLTHRADWIFSVAVTCCSCHPQYDCVPETIDYIPVHHGFTPRNSGSDRRTWTPIPKFFSPRRFNTFRTRDALSSATAYPLNEASLHQKPASPHNERSRTHPSISQRCHQHKQTRERVGECRSSLLSTRGLLVRVNTSSYTRLVTTRNDLLTTTPTAWCPDFTNTTFNKNARERTALTPATVTFR